jgi:hypothetical protein
VPEVLICCNIIKRLADEEEDQIPST